MATLLHECHDGGLYLDEQPDHPLDDYTVSVMVNNRHGVMCRVNRNGNDLEVKTVQPVNTENLETILTALQRLQDLKHHVLQYMAERGNP